MKVEFPLRLSDIERFKSKINKLENGCWRWKGARGNHRGKFSIKAVGRDHNVNIPAHRFAWFESRGFLPDGQVVQTCGNTLCVNPNHLLLKKSQNPKPVRHSETISPSDGQVLQSRPIVAQRPACAACVGLNQCAPCGMCRGLNP